MTGKSAPLVVYGREFEGFTRAFDAQFRANSDIPAEHRLIEISRLEELALHGDEVVDGSIDILLLNTDWLPSMISAGRVLALDDFLLAAPPSGWPGAWLPSLRSLQQDADGRTYGTAYHDGPMMLLYRRDLYSDRREANGFREKYGYDLAPATTWDEFVDQARWFDRPEQGLRGTILAGFPDQHNNIYDFLTQLWGRGGDIVTADGASGLQSDAARQAVAFLRGLWEEDGVLDPQATGWDSVASGVHFANGEAALMVNWCGFAALSADPASPTHGMVGCAPVPAAVGPGCGRAMMNSYWVLTVASGCRRPEAAYELIRRLAEADMDAITALSGGTATRVDTWNRPEVRELAPYYAVLEEAHQSARAVPRDPRWPNMAAILDEMMRVVVGGGDALAALVAADAQLTALLDRGDA